MTDLDTEEPLSSDSSFVILGKSPLPFQENDQFKEPKNLTSASNSKGTFSGLSSSMNINDNQNGSIFPEETIQKKLNDLVKENYQLKETLSQNNLAIKSQLETFFMWQQEILKTHETHKQKFLETKDLVLKLRAENASLKKQFHDPLVGGNSINEIEIYAQVNKNPEELHRWKEAAKEYAKIYNYAISENENLNMKILKLNEELKAAKCEILKLTKELEDLGRDNTYLEQRSDDFNKNSFESTPHRSLPNSEARAQITNLLKQLDEEKSKVLKLKEQLKRIQLRNKKASDSALSTTEELNQYIDNLNDMNASLNMQSQRFSGLQDWVCLAEESVKENKIHAGVECNLLCEIKELKSHLNQEENVSREKQETLKELKQKFITLLDDYKALQLKLSSVDEKETNTEKHYKEISTLSAKLEAKDNDLKLKEQECNNLKKEIDVFRLKLQEYEYFKNERAAREKFVREEKEMAEPVQHLKTELKGREKDVSETSPPVSSGKKSEVGKTRSLCYRCMLPFSVVRFEEHVEDCMNTHFYP